jgi:hypothetical protein
MPAPHRLVESSGDSQRPHRTANSLGQRSRSAREFAHTSVPDPAFALADPRDPPCLLSELQLETSRNLAGNPAFCIEVTPAKGCVAIVGLPPSRPVMRWSEACLEHPNRTVLTFTVDPTVGIEPFQHELYDEQPGPALLREPPSPVSGAEGSVSQSPPCKTKGKSSLSQRQPQSTVRP